MEDNEKTFAELYDRIEKTVAVLKGAKKETFVDVVRIPITSSRDASTFLAFMAESMLMLMGEEHTVPRDSIHANARFPDRFAIRAELRAAELLLPHGDCIWDLEEGGRGCRQAGLPWCGNDHGEDDLKRVARVTAPRSLKYFEIVRTYPRFFSPQSTCLPSLLRLPHLRQRLINPKSLDITRLIVMRRTLGQPLRLQWHHTSHELLAGQNQLVEDDPLRSHVHQH